MFDVVTEEYSVMPWYVLLSHTSPNMMTSAMKGTVGERKTIMAQVKHDFSHKTQLLSVYLRVSVD